MDRTAQLHATAAFNRYPLGRKFDVPSTSLDAVGKSTLFYSGHESKFDPSSIHPVV
jgi:hypothetical protein